MKTIPLLMLIFTLAVGVYADQERHPLDPQIQQLIEAATSPDEQLQAYNKCLVLWQEELDKVSKTLTEAAKENWVRAELLSVSQKAWNAHRSADVKFLASMETDTDSEMAQINGVRNQMKMTRMRVIELLAWQKLFTPGSQVPSQEELRIRGTVLSFDDGSGIGIIKPDNNIPTIGFYWTSIVMDGYAYLKKGNRVEFSIGKGRFQKREALRIVLID